MTEKVERIMAALDSEWRTCRELSERTGEPVPQEIVRKTIARRLKWGEVERKREGNRTYWRKTDAGAHRSLRRIEGAGIRRHRPGAPGAPENHRRNGRREVRAMISNGDILAAAPVWTGLDAICREIGAGDRGKDRMAVRSKLSQMEMRGFVARRWTDGVGSEYMAVPGTALKPPIQDTVYAALDCPMTSAEIAGVCGLDWGQADRAAKRLLRAGRVRRIEGIPARWERA